MSDVSISRAGGGGGGVGGGGGGVLEEWFLGLNLARRQAILPDAFITFPCPIGLAEG